MPVERLIPLCRVERGSVELLEARNLGDFRSIEHADARNDDVGGPLERAAVGGLGYHVPKARSLVELRGLDFGLESHVLADAVVVGRAFEVIPEFAALREQHRPVMIGGEGIRIEVIGRVDAAAGIGVLVPGAAHGGILFHDGERDAGLLQANGGAEAGHARADDEHAEVRRRREIGLRRIDAGGIEQGRFVRRRGQFDAHHANVFLTQGFTGGDGQHLVQQLAFGQRRRRCAGGGMRHQDVEQARADGLTQRRRHFLLIAHGPGDERTGLLEPGGLAGELYQH
jgi:hypothetical protein